MIRLFTPSTFLSTLPWTLYLLTLTNAQSGAILDPSKLPQCALTCPQLVVAQQNCLPPAAPQSNQLTYNICFCNSNFLAQLKAGQVYGTCDGYCGAAEMQTVVQWFQGTVCSTAAAPAGNTNAQGRTTTTRKGQTTATATAASASSTGQRANSSKQPSWISTHYQWVIMVVILVFAAAIAIWLGLWFKRRHHRRHLNDPAQRSSVLMANEAAASLRNKHPAAPSSMSQLPVFGSSASLRSGPMSPGSMSNRNIPGRHPSLSGGWTPMTNGVGVGAGAAAAAAAAATRGPHRTTSSRSELTRPDRAMSAGSDRGGPRRTMSLTSDVAGELKGKDRVDITTTPTSTPGVIQDLRASSPPVDSQDQVAPLPRRPSSKLQKRPSTRSQDFRPGTPGSQRPASRRGTSS